MPQKPWLQLAFILGEAGLSLVSSGVLFIVISRVSGPELLGTYALAFSWLMLFQGMSSFGIPEFLMREVGGHGRDAAGQVVHAMLLGLGSGFVAICLMLTAVRLLGYPTYLVQVITIASLALIPAFLNSSCRSVFLALRKMHLTFLALLVEVTIVMSASLYLLLSGHGAIALIITLVVAKFTSASIAVTLLYRRVLPVLPPFNPGFLMKTARTVITFGIGNMLAMLTMRINTIMVSAWVDIATVGHFAAATKIMEIGLIIPNLFAQLLMTRISYSFNTQGNRDPNRFGAWYQVLFAFVVPACVGGWVFAGLILETLFGTGFGNASWILKILMIYMVIEISRHLDERHPAGGAQTARGRQPSGLQSPDQHRAEPGAAAGPGNDWGRDRAGRRRCHLSNSALSLDRSGIDRGELVPFCPETGVDQRRGGIGLLCVARCGTSSWVAVALRGGNRGAAENPVRLLSRSDQGHDEFSIQSGLMTVWEDGTPQRPRPKPSLNARDCSRRFNPPFHSSMPPRTRWARPPYPNSWLEPAR